MKYVAILNTKDEFSEDEINALKATFFFIRDKYCFDIDSIKEVPESKPKINDGDDDNYFIRYYNGYNQALRDCGVSKEPNLIV